MTRGEGWLRWELLVDGENSRSLHFGRDDKGRGVAEVGAVSGWENCRSLHFGRDDKGRGVAEVGAVSGW
jgi:hypothetical protein